MSAAPPPGAAVELGYASGRVARRLSAADRARLERQPLQDLLDLERGRFTLAQDDGVLSDWGLDAIRARAEASSKPYAALRRRGHYQTERVIFADLSTGATMMKLTNEPYGSGDELIYFGKSCFSANGALMLWQRSARPSLWGPGAQEVSDTHGPLVVNGDGTQPRLVFRDLGELQAPICDPADPDLAYSLHGGDLLELNLRTEQLRRVVATGLPGWWLKVSPDGKYAVSARYAGGLLSVVALATGQRWDVPLAGRIHDSYRFVPGDTDWVMYWREGELRDQGFRMVNFRTGEDKAVPVPFDWNHGDVGRTIGFHTDGQVYRFAGGTWSASGSLTWPTREYQDEGAYYDLPATANGYAQHRPDDQLWAYGTRIVKPPFLSEVDAFFAKPLPAGGRANRFRICTTNLRPDADRTGAASAVLDRPNISPDGTKLLFNSNVFGTAEVYLVVLHNPQAPVQVRARWTKEGVALSWQAPRYHQEVAGYRVYRSTESGRGFELLSPALVTETTFLDRSARRKQTTLYAVRAVEYSHLESELSAEAAVARTPQDLARAPARLFYEAEAALPADLGAPPPNGLWLNFDGLASDLHSLWQRRKDAPGRLTLTVEAPRAGEYYVYARVKGTQGARFGVGTQTVSSPASQSWHWVRSPGTVRLRAGRQQLPLISDQYGSCLDCLYLATDARFTPEGRVRAAVPAAPTLTTATPTEDGVRLSWSGRKDTRWSHYNLYCSDLADFTCDRTALIASPDGRTYLDWQAPSGPKYYRVTQVTLDGLESAPSQALAAW